MTDKTKKIIRYIFISLAILTIIIGIIVGLSKVHKINSEYEVTVKNTQSNICQQPTETTTMTDKEVSNSKSKPTTTTTKKSSTTITSKKTTTTSTSTTTTKIVTETFPEKEYKAQVREQVEEQVKGSYYPTESERILLVNLVAREYGAAWISVEEKAKVVAVVMNRVNSSQFPNDIWSVIHQSGQFEDCYTSCWGLSDTYYSYQVTDSVVQAVDYYFNNTWAFDSNIMYYYGDGRYNYFD